MATTTRPADANPEASEPVRPPFPPLQNGDRLTRPEFERRYEAMPQLKKAELLDGIVYIPTSLTFESTNPETGMASPVSFSLHANPHFNLVGWMAPYCAATPGVAGGDNGSIRLDLDSMPQPDVFLIVLPSHGGEVRIGEDGFIEGAPELVAEVAASSVNYDLHVKLNVYRRNGVREYLVWRVFDRAIDWFVLRDGRFDRLSPDPAGLYQSEVFPGLWLDPAALLRGDLVAVAQAAQRGIAAAEHAELVERLRRRAAEIAPGQPGTAGG